jgi:alkylation response protein AidB-like acyl-CoA dehydrogenase
VPSQLATPAELAGHPAVLRAEQLAAELLAPCAQDVDLHGLPRSHVDAVRAAGLFPSARSANPDEGDAAGADAAGADTAVSPRQVARAVTEILSGACGTTWFVLTQHALPLAMVEGSSNARLRAAHLQPLATGEMLAGVAFTHVRRPGPPQVKARPAGDGWAVDGTVTWFTGWGLADVWLLVAQTAGDLVFLLVDAREQPGLAPGGELALAAMGGTHTVSLEMSGLQVGPDRVVDIVPRESWLAADEIKTANVTAALFGLLRAVVTELESTSRGRRSAEGAELAARIDAEGGALRSAAYRLIDDVPAEEAIDERLRLRAAACELTVRASSALVAAQAGGAMLRSAPAQRWAREALFHQVQAQTVAVRAAQLRRYAEVGR